MLCPQKEPHQPIPTLRFLLFSEDYRIWGRKSEVWAWTMQMHPAAQDSFLELFLVLLMDK